MRKKPSSKTLGYIVIGPWGAMKADRRGVLWISTPATLFHTREAAKAAIKQSERYRARKGYTGSAWKTSNRWIWRVKEAPDAK